MVSEGKVYLRGPDNVIRVYQRIPFGKEDTWERFKLPGRCAECNVLVGHYHTEDCRRERCPSCNGQFSTCQCHDDPDISLEDVVNLRKAAHMDRVAEVIGMGAEHMGIHRLAVYLLVKWNKNHPDYKKYKDVMEKFGRHFCVTGKGYAIYLGARMYRESMEKEGSEKTARVQEWPKLLETTDDQGRIRRKNCAACHCIIEAIQPLCNKCWDKYFESEGEWQ